MNAQSALIRKIQQKDNYTFTIEWSDGAKGNYRLSDLQKQCPCAKCVDETTGRRRIDASQVDPQVRAVRLASVGLYALKIQFTSGCSTGIYGYDMLYKLARGTS